MACIHDTRAPSPSLSGFSTPISEPPFRRLDAETPACTPETDLTPTQCVLRNVLSIDTGGAPEPGGGGGGGGGGGSGHSPTPSDEPPEHFANSVLKLHDNDGSPGGAGAEGQRGGQADDIRLQCQSGGGGGFLEGLFGCLKPVWTMIGKAYSTEHKHNQEGKRTTRKKREKDCWLGDNLYWITVAGLKQLEEKLSQKFNL